MARPPKITPTLTAQVVTRLQRGETIPAIAVALGVSKSTVDRTARLAKTATRPAAPVPGPPPSSDDMPEEISDGVDPAQVRRWIASVEKMARAAETRGEVGAFATLMTRYVQLLEHVRKTTPAPPPDPNANPDMLEARERGRAAMHALIDQALRP